MKVLVQKVLSAAVSVAHNEVASIKNGYVLFIGINKDDTMDKAEYLAKKVASLRIFTDENDKMNLSVCDVRGEILAISQFTLAADLSHGNRPGFSSAEEPHKAQILYDYFVDELKKHNITVKTGIFQAHMEVSLINDGPCTFWLEK